MDSTQVLDRYHELQQYLGWSQDHARRVYAAAPHLEPFLPGLIEDFYAEIERHPKARQVITGGREQIARLKTTLIGWLEELLRGEYDSELIMRRWRVGRRHVEIGLDQVYTSAALSRLRKGLIRGLATVWQGTTEELIATVESLNLLFDLDLAVIQEAYETEHNLRLARSQRLATIGQISGGIAHELRNPLNAIKTSVYFLLKARSLTPEKLGEHLGRISRQADKAEAVIMALSNFARLPAPESEPFDVAGTIQRALDSQNIPSHIGVRVDVDADIQARGDSEQILIVLGNLLQNAIDAMSAGGTLTITAAQGDGVVRIRVSDTGTGIDRHELSQIMEPLYTTKARGIGLGLAITRAIVDKHDGHIVVESEPGRGSVFTVELKSAHRSLAASGCPMAESS